MLTPGFGGPNGPAFPSPAPLSHAQGPHPLSANGYAPDCCCSLEVDGARPQGNGCDPSREDISSDYMAHCCVKKKMVDKAPTYRLHRSVLSRTGVGGLTPRGTIVSACDERNNPS